MLSGGERQRVTIARALVNDPAIVWADEPTGDLDSQNAEEITALLRRLNVERGLSLLIVTHDLAVGRATDRIVQMSDGAIVADEPAPRPRRPGGGRGAGAAMQRLFGIPDDGPGARAGRRAGLALGIVPAWRSVTASCCAWACATLPAGAAAPR